MCVVWCGYPWLACPSVTHINNRICAPIHINVYIYTHRYTDVREVHRPYIGELHRERIEGETSVWNEFLHPGYEVISCQRALVSLPVVIPVFHVSHPTTTIPPPLLLLWVGTYNDMWPPTPHPFPLEWGWSDTSSGVDHIKKCVCCLH